MQKTERSQRPWAPACALWGVAAVALVISLVSLAVNAVLISRLLSVQEKASAGIDQAIAALDSASFTGIHYDYHFEQTIPFEGDIPFKQKMTIPFEGSIPIDTTVEVPIDAGVLGTYKVKVPIKTTVYVNTEVPVDIDQTFHVSTEVPVNMTIPIDIGADDPMIQNLLSQIREWLIQLKELF